MAPANGWPMPQRMFWIASAKPNTSRPQSLACDIGVRKKPRVARGPKLIMEMRQPHSTITAGVRQPIATAFEPEETEIAMGANPFRNLRTMAKTADRRLYGVAPSSSNENLVKLLPPTHGS